MPNHIKNRIEIIGTPEQAQAVLDRFSTQHKAVLRKSYDGNFICNDAGGEFKGWLNPSNGLFIYIDKTTNQGLPEGFEPEVQQGWQEFPDFNKVIPQPDNIFNGNLGQKEREMCEKEGRPNWYDWNTENWGTKWSAYSCKKEAWNIFTFESAWSGVPRIMNKLAAEFPDVKFIYEYSDENTGYNCGYCEYENGTGEFIKLKGGSVEAYDLAFKLRPENKENYKLVDGRYEYIDEE